MRGALADLGLTAPVVAAPMAGGPSTPGLVRAAADVGGLGQLAGGYRTPDALASQIAEVRSAAIPFGVNLFAPNPVPVDRDAYRDYARELQDEADRFDLDLGGGSPVEDDDHWQEKLDLLMADPVPLVSFTFGLPDEKVVAGLRSMGTVVAQTVTSADEARLAVEVGVDALIVQSAAAGGHSGTFSPGRALPEVSLTELLADVSTVTDRPLIAAGGVATSQDVADALRAGAAAVSVGTALLRSVESGASEPYKAALADPERQHTVVTRAFSGRPARAVRNSFVDRHSDRAPLGYPAVHHLTSPLRKAATAAGEAELINLWAGAGHSRRRPSAEPAVRILRELIPDL